MTTRKLSTSSRIFIFGLALATSIFNASNASGQSYAGTKAWNIAWEILIKTPDKCCDIPSKETTEGIPNGNKHYQFYRDFRGTYIVRGPVQGYGMPRIGGDNAPLTGIDATDP